MNSLSVRFRSVGLQTPFTSEAEPSGKLQAWYQDNSINEQVLIFADKGFYHAEHKATSANSIEWWKFENLTQILEGGI